MTDGDAMSVWTLIVPAIVALTGAPLLIAVGLWVWGREEAAKQEAARREAARARRRHRE